MIFVTIGTTAFDSLIEKIDKSFPKSSDVVFQIADGKYKPVRFPFVTFIDNIDEYYKAAEIVICHGGAGTVYKLLEMKKIIIVVPNMTRSDPHQREMADYINNNKYGLVSNLYDDIYIKIIEAKSFIPRKYNKPVFIGDKLLIKIINSL